MNHPPEFQDPAQAPAPAQAPVQDPIPAQNPLEQWYHDIPPLTKIYTTATAFVALAIQFGYLTPFQLYYHPDLILYKGQYWRLLCNFLYFGSFGLDFLFHTFFMMRYFRSLEEGSFRGRRSDFLCSPLIFMMVYIWARRHPHVLMSFLGLFTFRAPWLPWVLLGFSLLISNAFPLGDAVGILVGHVYYFLEDIYPTENQNTNNRRRRRLLEAPDFLKRWMGEDISNEHQVPEREQVPENEAPEFE